MEALRRIIKEDRKVQHRHPPLLPARESEHQTQPARHRRRISSVRIATGQREAAEHWRAPRPKR
jgi:hypothetical protein